MSSILNISSSAEYQPEWMPFCFSIEKLLLNRAIQVNFSVQACLNFGTIFGIFVLIHQCFRCKIAIHGNLLLLYANIIALYLIYAFASFSLESRYLFLLFVYKHPCELLSPAWAPFYFYLPYYCYLVAFPAFHFFIMLERVRATYLAEKYENEGNKFGKRISLGIWIFSLAYVVYIAFSALADTEMFSHPQGAMSLTTNYNKDVSNYVTISTLLFAIVTPLCDWRISIINKEQKKKSRNFSLNYNLSQKYQLNENALTMRLILPLDASYACIYSIHLTLIMIIRAYQPIIPLEDYVFYCYLALTFLYLYMFVALIVCIQFVRFMRRKGNRQRFDIHKILPKQNDETNLHFKQLKAQWA